MSFETQTAFFSYCREDSEFALKLAEDLKAAGAPVWIDQLDIEPGAEWDSAVEEALANFPRMLVILSPVSVNSKNVRDEVSFALSRQKRVIPVLYRDCEVPFRLARLQHIDFRPDYARGLRILLRALGVGEAAPHSSTDAAAPTANIASAEEAALALRHAEELERERAAAAAQARLEEERRAAERTRLQQEERERKEAEGRALHEQSRREQRAVEQARLEEEARKAAERTRLAQEEEARKAAEIKARQERLRREEQESVERKRFDLARFEQEQRERAAAATPVQAETRPVEAGAGSAVAAESQTVRELQPPLRTGTAGRYIWIAAVGLLLIGSTTLLMVQRNKSGKLAETQRSEARPNDTAAQPSSAQPSQPEKNAGATISSATPAVTTPAGANSGNALQPEGAGVSTPPTEAPKNTAMKPVPKGAQMALKAAADSSSTSSQTAGGLKRVKLPADVSKNFLIHDAVPAYPAVARQAFIQGLVTLQVVINKAGAVQSISAKSGHPLLVPAAIDAVKQWRYRPFVVDDKPVEVETLVTVRFSLTK